jgi:hypothetical protein
MAWQGWLTLLTEVITNNAAALLALPIALEVRPPAGMDAKPLVFAVGHSDEPVYRSGHGTGYRLALPSAGVSRAPTDDFRYTGEDKNSGRDYDLAHLCS